MRFLQKNYNKSNYSQGFTIVELLIVIVVIGILAAITIVAYNGIQDRAHASSTDSDLSNLKRSLQMYYAENGVFPDTLEDMSAYGFAATGKMTYGDWGDPGETSRGQYKVSTYNDQWGSYLVIYFYDYRAGKWQMAEYGYGIDDRVWNEHVGHGWLTHDGSSPGCKANILEDCFPYVT